MNDSFAIRILETTKSFPSGGERLVVLNNLNLTVTEGERVALIGESGAGKSTLLHIASGLDNPDKGEIYICGIRISGLDGNSLARFRAKRIGMVLQYHYLLPEFDAKENVMIPALIMKMPFIEAGKRAENLLSAVGLSKRFSHKPGTLSGGEQQRTAIARALINDPDILLADEPTGNLDEKNALIFLDLLMELQQKRLFTLLIATHSGIVTSRCTRTVRLSDGKCIEP